MSSFNYLIPTVFDAPDSYDVTMAFPPDSLAERLAARTGEVVWSVRVYHEGRIVEEKNTTLSFTPDRKPTSSDLMHVWHGSKFDGQNRPAFVENSFTVASDASHFTTKVPFGSYALYSAPGRPSFRADPDYKFGSPPVIKTVTSLGRLIDGYPVIRLDREKGYGESLACINPYGRPIHVAVRTHDGRNLPPQRVQPLSAIFLSLEPILKPDESRWTGRIQITANNRILLAHVRHRFGDPRDITDHEHLDPFRADETHMPATQWLRQAVGKFASNRFGLRW